MKLILTSLFAFLGALSFGQIFSPGTPISVSDTLGNYYPQMEMTGDGVPAVIWTDQNENDLYFAKHNGVDDFDTPIKLNPTGTDVQAYNWSGANIAVEGDNIYVVYRSLGFNDGHIYLVKSTNNGATWSDTVRVDYVDDGFAQFPDIAVMNDTCWVVLLDHDPSGLNPHYRVTRSPDGGATWEPDVLASALWPGESCDCCSPEIQVDASKVIVTTRNNDSNIREFKCVVSNDRGTSFTDMFSVDDHNWFIMSCPSTGADSRFYGQNEFLVVYRTEFGGDPKVYMNQYDLVGDSAIAIVDIQSDASVNNSLVNYPQMSYDANDDRIALVWESLGNGIDVFLNTSTTGAVGLLPANAINLTDKLGTQSRPDIIVKDGKYHIVYMDTDGFDVKYVQVTESGVGIEESHPFEVSVFPNPANNVLTIAFENRENEKTEIQLVNVQGEVVKSTTTTANSVQFERGVLAAGMYTYRILRGSDLARGSVVFR